MIGDILWESQGADGFEHLKYTMKKELFHFDGIIVHRNEDETFRVFYQLVCDNLWRFKKLELLVEGKSQKSLNLNIDKSGLWYDERGAWYQQLEGCLEPDISFTPFTNTLPINRLMLKEGESIRLKVAYINLPELTVSPVWQTYECISKDENGGVYLYKNHDTGFETEIQLDKDSFVVNYPDFFRKII